MAQPLGDYAHLPIFIVALAGNATDESLSRERLASCFGMVATASLLQIIRPRNDLHLADTDLPGVLSHCWYISGLRDHRPGLLTSLQIHLRGISINVSLVGCLYAV